MSNDLDTLTEVLTRYISPVNARALVSRALRDNGLSATTGTRRELRKCDATLRNGIQLFVTPTKREGALRELANFYGADSLEIEATTLRIRTEADVGTARSAARKMCDQIGTDPFTMQKVTTIVSELARNIVLYAKTGTIELRPAGANGRTVAIRAVDQGQGIANLDHIMSGNYKSKTGLGRGLAGTKRISDRFDVTTGAGGTTVDVEVKL
ncbi:MAG TPA: ATP-binding protein [Polyangiaceae bacterium]|nr:ATP-binding protein [Polyangiaceae bacterium]